MGWTWPKLDRARTGCGGRRRRKTFLGVRVRKHSHLLRISLYNRASPASCEHDGFRSPTPHRDAPTRAVLGASENPGAARRVAKGTHPEVRAAQRDVERSATEVAGSRARRVA